MLQVHNQNYLWQSLVSLVAIYCPIVYLILILSVMSKNLLSILTKHSHLLTSKAMNIFISYRKALAEFCCASSGPVLPPG